MAKIGILGGTFDPIHYAHMYMGAISADELELEMVVFVPNGTPPHKSTVETPGSVRLEMTKLAIANNTIFTVSDYEITKDGVCYTIDTVRHFKQMYPGDELYFIIGEDSLSYLEQWYDAKNLFKLCEFIVIGRGGYESDIEGKISELSCKHGFICHYIEAPELDISSEGIRKRICAGKTVDYLLPRELIEYININNIYS